MDQKNEGKYQDPLIDDVRERRRQVFADHGNDLRRLIEAIQRRQADHPEMVSDLRRRNAKKP